MKFSLSTMLVVMITFSVILGWYLDHQNLEKKLVRLREENAILAVQPRNDLQRRNNVLNLVAEGTKENLPALIETLTDNDPRIAMEARAGLETITRLSFRQSKPFGQSETDLLLSLRNEQTKWKQWLNSSRNN